MTLGNLRSFVVPHMKPQENLFNLSEINYKDDLLTLYPDFVKFYTIFMDITFGISILTVFPTIYIIMTKSPPAMKTTKWYFVGGLISSFIYDLDISLVKPIILYPFYLLKFEGPLGNLGPTFGRINDHIYAFLIILTACTLWNNIIHRNLAMYPTNATLSRVHVWWKDFPYVMITHSVMVMSGWLPFVVFIEMAKVDFEELKYGFYKVIKM